MEDEAGLHVGRHADADGDRTYKASQGWREKRWLFLYRRNRDVCADAGAIIHHGKRNGREGRSTCRIGDHDGLGVLIGEVEPIAEEEGANERQVFKLLERDGCLEQLPFGLQREELVDKLLGIRQEIVVVIFVAAIQFKFSSFRINKKQTKKTFKLPKAVGFALAARLRHFFGVDKVTGSPVALDKAPSSSHVNRIPRIAEAVVFEAHAGLVTRRFRITLDDDAMESGVAD